MSSGEEATRQALRARLRELVATARPGDRLPSERVLSRRWHAARMTVRSATDALVAEGLVVRRHGSGTYVQAPPVIRFLGLTSFTQDMRARGLVPGSRMLAFSIEPADGPTAARLRVPEGDPVHRFSRLRTGNGEPMAIETVRIASTLVPGLAPTDLDGSLYELLATRYQLRPGSADVTIEPLLPDRDTRRTLGIPDQQACLLLHMTDADQRGRVVMVADCIYRGDRYQLSAHVPAAFGLGLVATRAALQVGVRRVLAVDGGQSTIRVRHSTVPETIDLAGISHLEGDTVESVAEAVIDGWRATGAPAVDRAVLGLTTAPTDEASGWRLCRTVATGMATTEVWLADDAVTAHAGALTLGWGVSVTAGTGVACLAMPREGGPRIIGGHGYLVGDEGGAFWIGREGVRAVLRAHDGRGPRTALSDEAARRFDGLDDLGARLHAMERPVDAIARFAPDVLATAETGDPVATAIAEEAANELCTLVRAAIALVGDAGAVPVALGGRLLPAGGPLRRRLDAAIAGSLPDAEVRSADGTPLDGALLLGDADDPGRYRDLVHIWRAA